jgi:hypothetical protein
LSLLVSLSCAAPYPVFTQYGAGRERAKVVKRIDFLVLLRVRSTKVPYLTGR